MQPDHKNFTAPGVSRSLWYGLEAWRLESERLRVLVVPELGAKLVSLYDRQAEYEWLVPPLRPPKPLAYGTRFVDQDMSGWDEMFPTIDACAYPVPGRFVGNRLPDHGEVWSLPWSPAPASAGEVALQVEGKALPYRLVRRISLSSPDTLRLDYTLVNLGQEELFGLWAAHPQFHAGLETRVVLPAQVGEVLNVVDSSLWGPAGSSCAWPETIGVDGNRYHLDRLRVGAVEKSRKVYLPPETRAEWARLVRQPAGNWLSLEWAPQEISYLGIWVDQGEYHTAHVIALEPSTGFYDRLDRAWQLGRSMVVPPGGELQWALQARCGLSL